MRRSYDCTDEFADAGRHGHGQCSPKVFIIVFSFIAVWQWWEAGEARDEAKSAAVIAQQERNKAEHQLKNAQTTQSLFLADLAQQYRQEGDAATAILLALEVLPDITAGISQPHVPEVELQLEPLCAIRAVRMLDLSTGAPLFLLGRQADWITDMSITADGRHAVSTSEDYTATVWNLEDRSSTATFMGESSLSSCALSPVSNDIAIGDASGRVHLLRLET